MESFHHSKGQCENCGLAIEVVGYLQAINYWETIRKRLFPYYLYVCEGCYESRETWCQNIYPDHCERCNIEIEDADHCLEKELNLEDQNIVSFGLTKDEKCHVICHECHNQL